MPGLVGLALVMLISVRSDDPPPAPLKVPEAVLALESALVDSIARAEASVVAISRRKDDGAETTAIRGQNPNRPAADPRLQPGLNQFLQPEEVDPISTDFASGVVIGPDSAILTAFHAVKGASGLTVRAAGRVEFEAEIIAADPRSDLAVIAPRAIPGQSPAGLRPIGLGDASTLRKGSILLALGNPYNAARDGSASAGWGILSNVARKLEPTTADVSDRTRQTLMGLRHYPTLLQLDAKLNLGMSGGAVVNLKGELVGLTTANANAAGFDAQAGYAIPIDALSRRAIEALRRGKEVEYGFLGIVLDTTNGTNLVREASAGSPAAAGGIHANDRIVAVGGLPVTDSSTLVLAINAHPVGRPVSVRLRRGDTEVESRVTLAKLNVEGSIATNRPSPWRGIRVDYSSILTTPQRFTDHGLTDALTRGGVAIADVEEFSPADQAGLKGLKLIMAVAGKPVATPSDFAEAVSGLKGPVELTTELGVRTVK